MVQIALFSVYFVFASFWDGRFGRFAIDPAEKDIVLNTPMKVQSIEAVKRCVMNNLGIAVVPTYSIGEELLKEYLGSENV